VKIENFLLAYRVMAWVTGTGLVILVFVAMPLKYFWGQPMLVSIVGMLHGFFYMAYIVCTLVLAERCRWRPLDALVILACGTIPLASFFAERRVTARVRAGLSPLAAAP
jgi:integral membrane protein